MRKLKENLLIRNRKQLPSEIKRFRIPKRSFKKSIGAKIGGPVNLIHTNKETVEISIPYNVFEKILEKRYKKEIKSLNIEEGKVGIDFTEKIDEKEKNSNGEANERKLGNIFGLLR